MRPEQDGGRVSACISAFSHVWLAEDLTAVCLHDSLTWPVIIAGSQLYGGDRARVLSIFELFRYGTRLPFGANLL